MRTATRATAGYAAWRNTITLTPAWSARIRTAALAVLATLGLSFWFWLAYPWANHNESYALVVQLETHSLLDVLTQPLQPVTGYRPLGVALAWAAYKLAGGQIWLVQLFNYVSTLGAWLVVWRAQAERTLAALVFAVASACFFSGYIYLFHLHGVFYGPALLYLAVCISAAGWPSSAVPRRLPWMFLGALVLSLFHPFVLLMYLAWAAGAFVQARNEISRGAVWFLLLSALVTLILSAAVGQGRAEAVGAGRTLDGLLTSYAMVDIHPALSAVAVALSLLAAASIPGTGRERLAAVAAAALLSAAFAWARLPLVCVWALVCLAKAGLRRQWAVAGLLAVTSVFPALSGTGSPTYTIFALLVCAAITPTGLAVAESHGRAVSAAALLGVALAVVTLLAVRNGAHLPVVSQLVNPLLAEREKTYQMENVIGWLLQSPYRDHRLTLCEEGQSPVNTDNAADRRYRAPTSTMYLSPYLDRLRLAPADSAGALRVCFGGQTLDSQPVAYQVDGRYAGRVTVYAAPR